MKINSSSSYILAACLLFILSACKQEYLQGPVVKAAAQVYLPQASQPQGMLDVLNTSTFKQDTVAGTINFAIPVYRGGETNLSALTVNVSADNSTIPGLMFAGQMGANTVILDPSDYILPATDSVTVSNNIMKGMIIPKIKIASLSKYSGKIAALGIKISNASKYSVNDTLKRVILFFKVDDLIAAITPVVNEIVTANWTSMVITPGASFTVNADGSALAMGNGGHAEIWQAVTVLANKPYKIDMNVAGSGASNTWFEVYVGKSKPLQRNDPNYSDYNDGGKLLSLNTWAGCGGSPFNGALSVISCTGNNNTVTFSSPGTVYVLIRAGSAGGNMGTTGITLTNINFIRVTN